MFFAKAARDRGIRIVAIMSLELVFTQPKAEMDQAHLEESRGSRHKKGAGRNNQRLQFIVSGATC